MALSRSITHDTGTSDQPLGPGPGGDMLSGLQSMLGNQALLDMMGGHSEGGGEQATPHDPMFHSLARAIGGWDTGGAGVGAGSDASFGQAPGGYWDRLLSDDMFDIPDVFDDLPQTPNPLGAAGYFSPQSTLVSHLKGLDPAELVSRAGLPPELWQDAIKAIQTRGSEGWEALRQQLGKDAGDALLRATADDLVSGNLNKDGTTSLFASILPTNTGHQPSVEPMWEAAQKNLNGAVTRIDNPTLEELEAILGTNKIENMILNQHGLPGAMLGLANGSSKHEWLDSSLLADMAGKSEKLKTVILNMCYGGMGKGASTAGQIQAKGITTIASDFLLHGGQAEVITDTATRALGQGFDPVSALTQAEIEHNKNFGLGFGINDLWALSYKAYSGGQVYNQGKPNENKKIGGLLAEEFGNYGWLQADGSLAQRKSRLTRMGMDYRKGNNKAIEVLPGSRASTDTTKAPTPEASTTRLDGGETSATSGKGNSGVDATFGMDEGAPVSGVPDVQRPSALSKLSGVLENGLEGFGLFSGAKEAVEGLSTVGASLTGQADQRSGVVALGSILSGGADAAQSAASLAGNVKAWGPALSKLPWVKALANNKHLGMLSALPSVAGFGYDLATGADASRTFLSGGEAVEGVGTAALATYGGPMGAFAAMGVAGGEGVYNAAFNPSGTAPKSLGEMAGMAAYSVNEVGEDEFKRRTALEMAFDSRKDDPNANGLQQFAGQASQSIGQTWLMADHLWHSMLGDPNASMLSQTYIPKPEETATGTR